ncbi:Anti-sigma regulatory factor (Ser/Thr protein kinase) [Streptomyces sp. DvalAA-14]|nr:Anti-sigma regulatory factor (Ser/Thr protein kinase) [Streptomyces sp. DvalAA-14]
MPAARGFAYEALVDWGCTSRADDVLLCVSELTTNALLHGVPPGRGFMLQLSRDAGGVLRIEVHDSGDGRPRLPTQADGERGPDPDQMESGRGLFLVDALADKWDVGERTPGKVVWCEFAPRG